MKKKILFILGIVIIAFIVFLGYRSYLVYFKYKVVVDEYVPTKGTLGLSSTEECDFHFKGLSICLPDGFTKDLDRKDNDFDVLYSNGEVDIAMSLMKNDLSSSIEDIDKHIDAKKIMKKYDISTMTDVLHYLDKHGKDKFTIFSKLSDIQFYYVARTLVDLLVPTGDVYYLDGDVGEGYMIKQKNNYFVYLYNGNNKYVISFYQEQLDDDYFNDDNVYKILSSIQFRDQFQSFLFP